MFRKLFGKTENPAEKYYVNSNLNIIVVRGTDILYNSEETTYNKTLDITKENIQQIVNEIILPIIIHDAYVLTIRYYINKGDMIGFSSGTKDEINFTISILDMYKLIMEQLTYTISLKTQEYELPVDINFKVFAKVEDPTPVVFTKKFTAEILKAIINKEKKYTGYFIEDLKSLYNPKYYHLKPMNSPYGDSYKDTDTLIEVINSKLESPSGNQAIISTQSAGSTTTKPLQKTNRKIQINGQSRVVYLNKYNTEYIKYKGEYLPLKKAMRLETAKPKP